MAEPVEERHGYVVDEDIDAIEYYFERGVTDGLPVVPPTEARMMRMLGGHGAARPTRSIALVPPNYGAATLEKIAVNAVMAGCKPEYLPVVVAGVQAMCAEQVSLHGVQGTTHTATPLFIVNGPVRQQLDINCATGVFGSGWRANATIGRALRLIMINIGGARPAEIDKSTMGHPGKYTFLIGEYEEASPWEPLHVEKGLPARAEHRQRLLLRRPAVHQQPWQPHRRGHPDHPCGQHGRGLAAQGVSQRQLRLGHWAGTRQDHRR